MATWVIVDDYDPSISYSTAWVGVTLTPSNSESIPSAAPFDATAHLVAGGAINATVAPASFSYTFSGSKLAVYGLASIFNQSVDALNVPIWECLVDNHIIPNNNSYGSYPLLSYCEADDLTDEIHSFEFRITRSGETGAWFDYLRYLPSPSRAVLANSTAWIGATDTRLQYGGTWRSSGTGFMTTKDIADVPFGKPSFFMDFNGSSLTWYGLSKAAIEISDSDWTNLPPINSSTAPGFYQIDAGDFMNFTINLSAEAVAQGLNPYSTPLFTTPRVTPGPHNLTVWYDGMNFNATSWPLTLDYLTIEDAFTTETSTVSAVPSSSTGKSKSVVIGGAVGGVLGGILLICLGLFVTRRWRTYKRRQTREQMLANLTRSDIKLRPFSRIVDPHEGKDAGNV